jgi:2-polyprenyl-6-methoxyphenol hydroxylase-like FAD-dependent oxidoreductase
MSGASHVLIVGGGIGGLTLAAALREVGIGVELVERAESWPAVGAGLSIQPNGMRILRRLGLDASVIRRGCLVKRWVFADHDGTALCEIDLGSVWGDVGPFVGIARAMLEDALVEGAAGVPCRLGTTVTSILDVGSQVEAELSDGSREVYDLVIGADGLHSSVRAMTFGDVTPTFAGHISWRSISPMTLPGPPSVQFWLGERCFFGLCSIGGGQTYGFGHVASEHEHDQLEGRLDRLRARFAHFGPTVQDFLSGLERDEQIHCSSISWVENDAWHKGRVVLVGDAAHATSPMMGQGANLAMEDAWVLAEVLRAEGSIDHALDTYSRRRKPRVSWVQEQSRGVAESLDAPPALRDKMIREHGEAAFRKRYWPLRAEP